MDKKQFMKQFPPGEEALVAKLYEEIEGAFRGRPVVSSQFYPPWLWAPLEEALGALPQGAGFYNLSEADRRLFASPLSLAQEGFCILKIRNKYPQRPLGHRDYLGALMALGLRREKFSDLVIQTDCCLIPTVAELCDYVSENLSQVAGNGVTVDRAEEEELRAAHRFEDQEVTLASLRLDCLVAEVSRLSRQKADGLISSGKVFVNYRQAEQKSGLLKAGDVLSLRGYGKYRLGEVLGQTRKGNLRLRLLKYL